jgi:hypothetical protein
MRSLATSSAQQLDALDWLLVLIAAALLIAAMLWLRP